MRINGFQQMLIDSANEMDQFAFNETIFEQAQAHIFIYLCFKR